MAKRDKRSFAEQLIAGLREKTEYVNSELVNLSGLVADGADRITGNADAASYMEAAKKGVERTMSALAGVKMALHAAAGATAEFGAEVQDKLPLEPGEAGEEAGK